MSGSAYYHYLHTALDVRSRGLEDGQNISVVTACHTAIHDNEVVRLYKSANIHLSRLDVNLEEMTKIEDQYQYEDSKGISRAIANKKHQLIAMCDTELQLMINKLKGQRAERKRIALFHQTRKAREDGWSSLMSNAERIRNYSWDGGPYPYFNVMPMIHACDMALRNETVLAFYKTARYPVDVLTNHTEVKMRDVQRHNLNRREDLILGCAMQLVMHDMYLYDSNGTRIESNDTQDVGAAPLREHRNTSDGP